MSHYEARAKSLRYGEDVIENSGILSKVYGYMSVALFITAFIAYQVMTSVSTVAWFQAHPGVFLLLILGELGLVILISAGLKSMSFPALLGAFVVYSGANGITLGVAVSIYTKASVCGTFVSCAMMFGALSIYGLVTKRNLDSVGDFCMMGLFGLLAMLIVNIFVASRAMDWLITAFGLIVFIGLTAYDTQKLKEIARNGLFGRQGAQKMALIGALSLYLDFVNLFLYLLRLFGVKK